MAIFNGLSLESVGSGFLLTPGRDAASHTNPIPQSSFSLIDTSNHEISLGSIVSGSPITPSPQTLGGVCLDSIGVDWINRIHIVPRRIDFGNILGVIVVSVDVFNAFRDQSVTLNSLINNVGTGLSFTNLPTLPFPIQESTGLSLNLEVTLAGDPVFDDTLDFIFDVSTASLPVTGTRLVLFPYEPQAPVQELLSFSTNVLESVDGTQQAVAIRKNPRQVFRYTMLRTEGSERARIDNLLFEWQKRIFGLPIRVEPMTLVSAASVGDTTVSVDTTDYADLRVGGLAAIISNDNEVQFDSLQVSSFNSNSITFNSQVTFAYPVGTRVFPIRAARVNPRISASRFPRGMGTFSIEFEVIDNDSNLSSTAAFNSLNGRVYLDGPNFLSAGVLRETYEINPLEHDSVSGAFIRDSAWARNKRGSTKGMVTRSRQELWEARGLIHALKGRQVPFYIPTFYDEFDVVVDLVNSDNVMTINNVGYSRFVKSRTPHNLIRLALNDGTILIRTVVDATEIDVFSEQLTVDVVWPSNIAVAEIDRIDFIELVRLDSDTVTINHQDSNGNASIGFPVEVVFE